MTTQVNPVQWQQKPLSLNRHIGAPFLELSGDDEPLKPVFLTGGKTLPPNNLKLITPNQTYLHSARLKQSLNESRKAFLSSMDSYDLAQESSEDNKEEHADSLGTSLNLDQQRRTPSRKISFKIKRNVPLSRRSSSVGGKNITTYSANTVAQLTLKFNKMVEENNAILEEPKFAKLVRRVNSQRKVNQDVKVNRKPSVKIKPVLVSADVASNKTVVKRKLSVKSLQKTDKPIRNDNKSCLKTKISYVDVPQTVQTVQDVKERVSTGTIVFPKSTGNVRATIERFERQTSKEAIDENVDNTKVAQKPKVPEKTITMKTKNVVIKDGVRKFKIYEKRQLLSAHNSSSASLWAG